MTPRTPTGLSVASPGYNYPDTPHYVDNPKLYDVIDRRYVYAHMDSEYMWHMMSLFTFQIELVFQSIPLQF